MKVLHVVTHGDIAGGQIVCLQLIETLLRNGHQACVVSPTEGSFTERLGRYGVPYFVIPFRKTYSFHRAFQLLKLLRRERIDLVHTHGMGAANIHSRIAAKWARIGCISHIHIANVFSSHSLIRRYQIFLDNWTSTFCCRLIAVSDATKKALINQGISPHRITVIRNGIDHERIKCANGREAVLKEFHIDPTEHLVGVVARLCPTKGQEDFLRAAKAVSEERPNVVWMVIGKDMEFNGGYEAHLRILAQELGLGGRVVFTGHLDDPLPLLNALDFLVLPSHIEGMPLVVLEAMALKKAVIATSVGGISEVVQNNKTGILIPPGDSQCLARAVLKLIRDHELARAMGEAGFERVQKNFSESEATRRVAELYREYVSG